MFPRPEVSTQPRTVQNAKESAGFGYLTRGNFGLDVIAPDYHGTRLLLPRLSVGLLSPLMLWWVLLFGLSMIARYDPELWVAALDVNDSPQAVPIEAALDEAMNALPLLILDALTTT